MEMKEAGVLATKWKRYLKPKSQCWESIFTTLGTDQIYTVFAVLVIGVAFAVILVFPLEKYVNFILSTLS